MDTWYDLEQSLTFPQALTAIILDESRHPDSKWAPYLAILPRQLDNLVFWSDAELLELQASKVVSKIGKSSAEEAFSKFIAPLGFADCNTEECHRVASVIMSYAFDIPETHTTEEEKVGDEGEDLVSDDEEDYQTVLSMIPLADMLCVYPCTIHNPSTFKVLLGCYHLPVICADCFASNADAERNNARLCCDNEDLEMRSIKPIARGEEIFNDYGQLPRSDLLRRYGYITKNYGLYDVAEISTQNLLSLFLSKEAFQGLNMNPLSQEELDSRVSDILVIVMVEMEYIL